MGKTHVHLIIHPANESQHPGLSTGDTQNKQYPGPPPRSPRMSVLQQRQVSRALGNKGAVIIEQAYLGRISRHPLAEKKWKGFLGREIGIYVGEAGVGMVLEDLMHKMGTPGLGPPNQGARALNLWNLVQRGMMIRSMLSWESRIHLFFAKDVSLPLLKLKIKTYGHWETLRSIAV